MAVRIEKVAGTPTIIRIIGRLRSEHIDALRHELAETAGPAVLDLDEVTLIDVEVVRFLNTCKAGGVGLTHVSEYIELWMRREESEEG